MDLKDLLAKNRPLKGLHAGKRCFIIGNGPSLNQQDLSILDGEITIAVNSFFHHPLLRKIAPKYWVAADPRYWQEPDQFLFPLISALNSQGVSTKLFMPTGAVGTPQPVNYGFLVDPHFFHYDWSCLSFSDIDLSEPVPPYGQNVICTALMLALHLGCNPIYLIGCDHSWWGYSRADYEQQHSAHFYQGPKAYYHEVLSYETLLQTISIQRGQYDALREYGLSKGVRIYNATAGGLLDSFSRVDFATLVRDSSPPPEALRTDALELGRSALRLMQSRDFSAARILLEEAMVLNSQRYRQVSGLEYLHAVCLGEAGYPSEARLGAQRDAHLFPEKQARASALVDAIDRREPLLPFASADILEIHAPMHDASSDRGQALVADLNRRGEALFEEQNYEAAVSVFSDLACLTPEKSTPLNNLGACLWQLGHIDHATAVFEQALRLNPQDRDVVTNLLEGYLFLGDHTRARAVCEHYLEHHPDDLEIQGLRAQVN